MDKFSLARSQGFTLIELVVVIVIIAILAAVSGAMIVVWNKNKQLSGSARNILGDMQLAKLQAIKNNCDVVVAFNAGGYTAFLDNGGPTEADGPKNGVRDATEQVVVQTSTPDEVDIVIPGGDFGGGTSAGFNSRALPWGGLIGSVVVHRTGVTDRWYRVRMSAAGQLILEKSSDSTDGSDGTWH